MNGRMHVLPRGGTVAVLIAAGWLAGWAATAAAGSLDPAVVLAQVNGSKGTPQSGRPTGANPYLSFLPAGTQADYGTWNAWLRTKGIAKRAAQPAADPNRLISVGESEPNNSQGTADAVAGFGTGVGDDPAADVTGTLAAAPPPSIIGPFAEDEGAIPLASPTGVVSGTTVRTSGTIGDGPYGSAGTGSGDFDFFAVPGLAAGDEILVDVDTPAPFCCELDPFVAIWSSTGTLLAFNDDQPMGGTYDSYLIFSVPASGTYYVSIGSYQAPFPSNPFDSSSGGGSASEGTYDVTIGVNANDRDHYSFDLEPGDVISANVLASVGTRLTLFDPMGTERVGSAQDLTFLEPGPFPAGGAATLAYVVETAGTYDMRVAGSTGAYTLELRAFRPAFEQRVTGEAQILFVDFDGATVDPAIFGAPPGSASLSPLSSFLAGWGLTPADETLVIDAILAAIEENLSTDMRVLGLNGDYDVSNIPGDFDVVILNSRDHPDPFGGSNVSRLIIGGTIPELGLATIGIAQSIDPGNFAGDDTAVVLLDLLSAPASDPNSLNQFGLAGGATMIDLVGAGVGNIASHEAGHCFANFHTDQFNAVANIMDQGGNLPNVVGVGGDLTLGTGDDVDIDFVQDTYVPNEGFTGTEDTLNSVAFGLSTGLRACPPAPIGTCRTAETSTLLLKDLTPNSKDLLVFRWLKGATTTHPEFGTPTSDTLYTICVYDAGGLVRSSAAPASGICGSGACWKSTGPVATPTGYRYRDPALMPSGTLLVGLKNGTSPTPKVLWKAKGDPLGDDSLGLSLPVTVEVSNSANSVCFGQTFTAGDVIANDLVQFKAIAN